MATKLVIEACVDSLASAISAEQAGADRVELNSAIELDGLTPSAGLVQQVVARLKIPVIAMVRARAGDFCYSESEWSTMLEDARWLMQQGVAGLAFGCLTDDFQVDAKRCHQMREVAGSGELVFHKAFDEVQGWPRGLEVLADQGVQRVMTSGQQPTAEQGMETLQAMHQASAPSLVVLAAGRVRSTNARQIREKTGIWQLHGSFRSGPHGDLAEQKAEIRQTRENLGLPVE